MKKLFLEETDLDLISNVRAMKNDCEKVRGAVVPHTLAVAISDTTEANDRNRELVKELSQRSKGMTLSSPDTGKFKPKKTIYTKSLSEAAVAVEDTYSYFDKSYIEEARNAIFNNSTYKKYFDSGEGINWDFMSKRYARLLDFKDSAKKIIDKDSARSKSALNTYMGRAFGKDGEGMLNQRDATIAKEYATFVCNAFTAFVNRLGYPDIASKFADVSKYLISHDMIEYAQDAEELFELTVSDKFSDEMYSTQDVLPQAVVNSFPKEVRSNRRFLQFYKDWKDKNFRVASRIPVAARYLLANKQKDFTRDPSILLDYVDTFNNPSAKKNWKLICGWQNGRADDYEDSLDGGVEDDSFIVGESLDATRCPCCGSNKYNSIDGLCIDCDYDEFDESYRSDMMKEFTSTLTNREVAEVYRKFADALEHADDDEDEESREFYRNLVAQAEAIAYHSDGDYENGKMIDDNAPTELIVALRDLFDKAEETKPYNF